MGGTNARPKTGLRRAGENSALTCLGPSDRSCKAVLGFAPDSFEPTSPALRKSVSQMQRIGCSGVPLNHAWGQQLRSRLGCSFRRAPT